MSPHGPVHETVISRFRSHGRALFWPCLALLAIAGAVGYFYGRFSEDWINLAILGGGLVAAVLLWLLPVLSWLGRNYTITTRRVVLRSGLFVRFRQELLHSRGYDLTVRKNSLQSVFKSGDVVINAGLEHPVVLRDVPNADLVQGALHELMESNANSVASRRQQEQSAPTDDTKAWGGR